MTTATTAAAGDHMPVFLDDEKLGYVISCTCGEKPKKRAARLSMQHVWHMRHRRTQDLPEVAYVGWWKPATGSGTEDGK